MILQIDAQAKAALADPNTKAVTLEMTPEMRERFSVISHEIMGVIQAKTRGPMEAYVILKFIMSALEERFGIAGAFDINNNSTD